MFPICVVRVKVISKEKKPTDQSSDIPPCTLILMCMINTNLLHAWNIPSSTYSKFICIIYTYIYIIYTKIYIYFYISFFFFYQQLSWVIFLTIVSKLVCRTVWWSWSRSKISNIITACTTMLIFIIISIFVRFTCTH